jgi:hypothetical protein
MDGEDFACPAFQYLERPSVPFRNRCIVYLLVPFFQAGAEELDGFLLVV